MAFGPRRSGKTDHVPEWFIPKRPEDQKIFDQGREDIKNVLLCSKEGVKVGNIMHFLEEQGFTIPFRALGFANFNEFLFHCTDFVDVRQYPSGCGYPPTKFLFLRPSAVDTNSLHMLQMVQNQATEKKKKNGLPRPTLKNLIYAKPESLLEGIPKYAYLETSASGPSSSVPFRGRGGGNGGGYRGSSRGAGNGGYSRGGRNGLNPVTSSSSAPRISASTAVAAPRNALSAIHPMSSMSVDRGINISRSGGYDVTDRVARNHCAGDGNSPSRPSPVVIPQWSGSVIRYYDPQNAPRLDPPGTQKVSRSFCYAQGLGPSEPTAVPDSAPLKMPVEAPKQWDTVPPAREATSPPVRKAAPAPYPPPSSRYLPLDDYDDELYSDDEEFELMSGLPTGTAAQLQQVPVTPAPFTRDVVRSPIQSTAVVRSPIQPTAVVRSPIQPTAVVRSPILPTAAVRSSILPTAVVRSPIQPTAVVRSSIPPTAAAGTGHLREVMRNLSLEPDRQQEEAQAEVKNFGFSRSATLAPAAMAEVVLQLDPTVHHDPRTPILPDGNDTDKDGVLIDLRVVNFISPSLIQVKTVEHESREELKQIEVMMSGWYAKYFNKEKVPVHQLIQAGYYAGFDDERMVWSRIQIDLTNKEGDLVKVYLIDHGYSKMMEMNNFAYLKPAYVRLSRQSFYVMPTHVHKDSLPTPVVQRVFMMESTGKKFKFVTFPGAVFDEYGIPVVSARFVKRLD